MSYVSEVLQPGEEIRFRTNIHWFVYLPAVVMFIVGIAFALWYTAAASQHLMLLILVLLKCCGWCPAVHTCMAQAVRHRDRRDRPSGDLQDRTGATGDD